jgi:hypothetical protein
VVVRVGETVPPVVEESNPVLALQTYDVAAGLQYAVKVEAPPSPTIVGLAESEQIGGSTDVSSV